MERAAPDTAGEDSIVHVAEAAALAGRAEDERGVFFCLLETSRKRQKMDIRSLSNMELKEELLKHGVNPGPILPSTRGVYEKKLQQLLEMKVQENGDAHEDQYSDSDDEGAQFKGPVGFEVNGDGGEGAVFNNYIQTKDLSKEGVAQTTGELLTVYTKMAPISAYDVT
ncbi:PREDICTED: LEM domain-containing protein 1 [Nanorana parkeri]|uniref:LEM domain-containing protein 1 n=1 Tax=Nanorana parkeri TaxID=125878 RepID=UPI0008545167|nr:PREDICTED: LEM domain-containing protein 1 [Nanorana parkeri]